MKAAWFLLFALPGLAGEAGGAAEYVGGTLKIVQSRTQGTLITSDAQSFVFSTKNALVRVPYDKINQIEYGQSVSRRYLESILISPVFMLAKKRAHFLTVAYETEDGQQQAMVFRVDKTAIRAVLISLEAKTGRRVVYQDEEARKAGKG
ncbi:MAG: hypothetical protein IT161_14435 [Bryobacterales bacterium]|nr:hypothetical protein [Bryobacterales bacterium]